MRCRPTASRSTHACCLCMLAVTEDEQSDEVSMATVIALCESGDITDETLVYTDDIEMDGWMPFGEVKESLDWDSGEDDENEEAGAFTSLYYQITEDEQSDECDMHEVIQLINDGVITDETMVWAEGLDGWVPFEEAKYYCEWPEDEAASDGPPETVYYESAPDENEEVPFNDFKLLLEGGMVNDETKVWAEGLSGVRADSTHPHLRCARTRLLCVHVHMHLQYEWSLGAVDAFGRGKGGSRS